MTWNLGRHRSRAYVSGVALLLALSITTWAGGQDKPGPKPGAPPKRDPPKTLAAGQKCSECHEGLAQGKAVVHGPVQKQQCNLCHEADGQKHAFKLVAEKGQLCLKCHELKLGSKVHAPLKQGICLDCHDPHASTEPKLLPMPLVDVCAKCHPKTAKPTRAFVHGPFGGGACETCHAPHSSENPSLLIANGKEVCMTCHEQIVPPTTGAAVVWHGPVKEDCTTCHSGHQSDLKNQLLKPAPDLCFECHEEMKKTVVGAKVPHKALQAKESCIGCHQPHVSTFSSLLKKEPMDLCLSCHDKEYPQGQGARPITDMAGLLKAMPNQHGPIRDRNCSGCHVPHGSQVFRLLKTAYPAEFYSPFKVESYGLCFSCHPKTLVLEEKSTFTGFRDGERSMHFLHVNKAKGRTCRACHETHASGSPRHIRLKTPFGKWDMPIRFEKTPTGGSCKPGCHEAKSYDRDKPVKAWTPPVPTKTPASPGDGGARKDGGQK